ncbi:MAG TPA: hypothetical protein VGB03_03580 [Acidimicrobiales bacterium]|jgi:osmotically-inducible protein OsmY
MSLEQTAPSDYLVGHVEEALACDPRVNEQGLHVAIAAGKVFVTGTVSTRERFDAVAEVVRELLPDFDLHNEATVADYPELGEEEHLS